MKVDLPDINPDKSLLVLANHHSWWDGFWVMRLNQIHWKKRFFVMMLKQQLMKHKTFSKTGAYSVDPGSRSIIESIEYTIDILSDKRNMVLLFPQGEIQSQHINHLNFEMGINRIVQRLDQTDIMLLSTFTDYFSTKKNNLYIYGKLLSDLSNVKEEFGHFYQQSKLKQSQWMD